MVDEAYHAELLMLRPAEVKELWTKHAGRCPDCRRAFNGYMDKPGTQATVRTFISLCCDEGRPILVTAYPPAGDHFEDAEEQRG